MYMAGRPTREELEQRILMLEEELNRARHTEKALREVEYKFNALVDHALEGIMILDLQGTILFANSAAALTIEAADTTSLIGRRVSEFIAPESLEDVARDLMQVAQGHDGYLARYQVISTKGNKICIESIGKLINYDDTPACLVSVRDITRVQAELNLQRRLAYDNLLSRISMMGLSEADLGSFLQDSIAALGETVDVSRTYLFEHRHETDSMDNTYEWCAAGISPQKENLQGIPAGAVPWWTETLKSGRNICFDNIEHIPDETVKAILRPQGILSLLVVPLFVYGRYWGFIGFDDCHGHRSWRKDDVDILCSISRIIAMVIERRQAEDALRQSEAKFRLITENMNDSIWMSDLDLRLTYVSPSDERLFGFSAAERLAQDLGDMLTPSSLEKASALLAGEMALVKNGQGDPHRRVSVELEYWRKDRSTIWVETVVSGIYDDEGNLIGLLGVDRDITERKKAEQERQKLEEQLNRSRKLEAIGTLAGGIAHDFNNLLMAMQGHISLMALDLDSSHPHFARLKSMEDHIRSGASLTSQLLGFARGGRYEVKPTNINNIIETTSLMFGRTRKDIILYQKTVPDLWTVEVDRSQMEQVFMNLYVNAGQAMPEGGEISTETQNVILDDKHTRPYGVMPGKFVKIEVADTGIGMDEKTKERIFDPFFTTKKMGRGYGLGLATVYGIIKGHGGLIDVASEPGKGSTFTIYLPASEKTVAKEEIVTGEILKGTETILLVDDEPTVLNVAKEMLRFLGYRVYLAASGQEAVAIYNEKQKEIDLVVLDMIMPGISGGETFDFLRKMNPQLKVILCSGYSIDGQAREILDKGCKGFLQKPFQLKELSQEIRAALS